MPHRVKVTFLEIIIVYYLVKAPKWSAYSGAIDLKATIIASFVLTYPFLWKRSITDTSIIILSWAEYFDGQTSLGINYQKMDETGAGAVGERYRYVRISPEHQHQVVIWYQGSRLALIGILWWTTCTTERITWGTSPMLFYWTSVSGRFSWVWESPLTVKCALTTLLLERHIPHGILIIS